MNVLVVTLLCCRGGNPRRRDDLASAAPRLRGQPPSGAPASETLGIPAGCNGRRPPRCNPEAMTLRCLIVDDNAHFLEAAQGLLERQGMAVVGVASTGVDALRRAGELRPDGM